MRALARREHARFALGRAEGQRADGIALAAAPRTTAASRRSAPGRSDRCRCRCPRRRRACAARSRSAASRIGRARPGTRAGWACSGAASPSSRCAAPVAVAVFGQLLEVGAFAAPLVGLDADFLQAAIAREPGVTRDLREVGIRARRVSVHADALEQLEQAQPGADAQVRGREVDFAAARRRDLVGDLDALVGAA